MPPNATAVTNAMCCTLYLHISHLQIKKRFPLFSPFLYSSHFTQLCVFSSRNGFSCCLVQPQTILSHSLQSSLLHLSIIIDRSLIEDIKDISAPCLSLCRYGFHLEEVAASPCFGITLDLTTAFIKLVLFLIFVFTSVCYDFVKIMDAHTC